MGCLGFFRNVLFTKYEPHPKKVPRVNCFFLNCYQQKNVYGVHDFVSFGDQSANAEKVINLILGTKA